MKIIISGATGFVGAHLTRYFSRKGHEVIALGRAQHPPARLLEFAAYHPVDWTSGIPAIDADIVIHAAALASDSASYKDLYAANVEGTRRLIEASEGVATFILISSSSVYSYRDNLPKAEADAGKDFDFLTDYGKTKWLSELELAKNINPRQKRLIIRPRVVYGIGDRVILPRLLNMVKGDQFVMPGPMKNLTSQTNVRQISKLIDWYITLSASEKKNLTLNLADLLPYRMGETTHELLSFLTDQPLKKKIVPIALIKGIARMGLSKNVTKFLVDAVTHDCVLDLSFLKTLYAIPPELTLQNELAPLKNWITKLGGLEEYHKKPDAAPWL